MYGMEGTDVEPSQEEIERVAKLANAHDFIQVRQCWNTEYVCLPLVAQMTLLFDTENAAEIRDRSR